MQYHLCKWHANKFVFTQSLTGEVWIFPAKAESICWLCCSVCVRCFVDINLIWLPLRSEYWKSKLLSFFRFDTALLGKFCVLLLLVLFEKPTWSYELYEELLLVRVGSVPQDQWLTLLITETKLQKKRRYFVSFTEETLKRSEQSW